MMSANMTAASTPCRRTGCSVTSAHSSGVFATSQKECCSRTARYSGSERPACRMNQTGVRSTGSRRAARTRSGSTAGYPNDAVSKGPLVVRWGPAPALAPQAGVVETVRVELENAGTVPWGDRMRLSYHWLDDRDNPIVWDGDANRRSRGSRRASRRRSRRACAPRSRRGRYRLAFDLVAEQRAWFSELGCPTLSIDLDVKPRSGEPRADLPPQLESRAGLGGARSRRRTPRATASSPARSSGSASRRPRALAPYAPGPGRVPGFAGTAALPVGAAGDRARAARRRRGPAGVRGAARRAVGLRRPDRAQSSTAIRSSTRVKTYAPSASAAAAATTR